MAFEPESIENVQREYNRVKKEIDELEPFEFEEGVTIIFDGWATMLDGKALGYITGVTGLQNCPLCGATPSKMSCQNVDFDLLDHEDILKHGLAPLHYKMRGMEFLIHLGMHSRIKTARVFKDTPNEESRNKREDDIKAGLYRELKIKVNEIRKTGGSSNTGPCAKRFFQGDPDIIAEILEIPPPLFIALRDIGNAISSNSDIDADEFQKLCDNFNEVFFTKFQKPEATTTAPRRGVPARGRGRGARRGGRRGGLDRQSQMPAPTPVQATQEQGDTEPKRPRLQRACTSSTQQTMEVDSSDSEESNSSEASSSSNNNADVPIRRGRGQIQRGRPRGTGRPRQEFVAETWYFMPSATHKVVTHGAAILRAINFPPGFMSEEPAEANNKVIRKIRETLTRKFNREVTMQDLFWRLLCNSDPLVLKELAPKRLKMRKKLPVHPNIIPLLKNRNVGSENVETDLNIDDQDSDDEINFITE